MIIYSKLLKIFYVCLDILKMCYNIFILNQFKGINVLDFISNYQKVS